MRAYYMFGKNKMPDVLNDELKVALQQVERTKSKEEALKQAYDIITSRYHGEHLATLRRLRSLFSTGIQDLWNRSGFLHCTNQNYLLHYLLVRSGKFKDKDIQPKWTLYWGFSPHQYLKIKLDGHRTVNVDTWSAVYGIEFGDYAHWFHTKTINREV